MPCGDTVITIWISDREIGDAALTVIVTVLDHATMRPGPMGVKNYPGAGRLSWMKANAFAAQIMSVKAAA